MRDPLLPAVVRAHGAAVRLADRLRRADGQATVEWIALMVGFAALVTLLAGKDVWQRAGDEIVDAVGGILRKRASEDRV